VPERSPLDFPAGRKKLLNLILIGGQMFKKILNMYEKKHPEQNITIQGVDFRCR